VNAKFMLDLIDGKVCDTEITVADRAVAFTVDDRRCVLSIIVTDFDKI
jgi:uncharacterized Rossmann fold enzyme